MTLDADTNYYSSGSRLGVITTSIPSCSLHSGTDIVFYLRREVAEVE
jgi:hypothetical protein